MEYVIIVGASDLVMPAYKIAREDLGLGIISFDYNSKASGMIYADVPIEISTKDVDLAVEKALELSQIYNIVGVFTCGADVEVTVAAISSALGLPGISKEIADRCNDKILMHETLDQAGFTSKARYKITSTYEEAVKAIDSIGLPCFIKPIDNCASRGVQRIDSIDELKSAFEQALVFNTDGRQEVLIEECLEGSKHTVEMITFEDKWYLLSIIDTHYISPKWPCETGLNTTKLSNQTQEKLFNFAKNVAKLVGVDFNAHKVDVNLSDNDEIKLIELTARLSGGFHCQYASPLAYGSNDIRAALKLSIGEPLDLNDIKHKYERGSAVTAVLPEPGIIKEIVGIDDSKRIEGVEEVFVWKEIGDRVGPYHNSADRPAFIISVGKDANEAIRKGSIALEKLKIITS